LTVPELGEGVEVVVYVYLINVQNGQESVQFSGRTDPITLRPGEVVTPDIPIVRGPIENLFVTGVVITSAPANMGVGTSQLLSATASTSRSGDQPQVFWTSLDPAVLTVQGSTVTAVAPGTGEVAASAGAFSDVAVIEVLDVLTVVTTSLPSGTAGASYSQTLTAAGGSGGNTWAIDAGSLPAQLSLNSSTGVISGTPTSVGSSTFTVRVTSGSGQTATRQLTITIYAPLAVSTTSLPQATVNAPYSATLTAAGGNGSYAWSLSAGALPAGLSLNGSSGAITGVPTAAGRSDFTVRVTSGDGQNAQRALFIQVVQAGFGQVVGVVYDAVTSQVIASASLSLTGGNVSLQTSTAANGSYVFAAVPPGTYSVVANATGYVQNTAANLDVVDVAGEVVRADFALPPIAAGQRFGGLSGRVLNNLGSPVSGAAVSISGGVQTNGIFRSTTTNADGTYSLVGIVLDDADLQPITQFTVLASATGFATVLRPVVLVQNETVPNVDFTLSPSQGGQTFFADNFETVQSWQTTGFWNRSTLAGIRNAAAPTYVNLAPGDDSNGALPAPVQGSFAFWYGSAAAGNFLGTQLQGDQAGSGGTSEVANAGSLTSPAFQIPANAPAASLRLATWFEIESVNPNDQGFDLMTISVLNVSTGGLTQLRRLNPFVDPPLSSNAIPFTSGGFNARPVWRTEYVDLSAFRGINIQLVFTFDTVDALYNGFRGWIIDDVSVTDEPVPAGAPAPAPPREGPSRPRASR
jgi:hypothetical protein